MADSSGSTEAARCRTCSAYYMLGAGGQFVIIVPSHDLVIVRIGHSKGTTAYAPGMVRALALLIQAVPAAR